MAAAATLTQRVESLEKKYVELRFKNLLEMISVENLRSGDTIYLADGSRIVITNITSPTCKSKRLSKKTHQVRTISGSVGYNDRYKYELRTSSMVLREVRL